MALAALPVAPAQAAPAPPEIVPIPPTSTGELLGEIPVGDLNVPELAELLARRPGLEDLPEGPLRSAIEEVLELLAKEGVTVEELGEPSELVGELEEALEGLLSHGELIELLKGSSLGEVLAEALGSLEPRELIGEAVGSSPRPEELITQALSGVNPEKLESVVGSTLAGEPFSKTNVEELANKYEASEAGFTEALGTTAEQLPPTAMAFTAPLTNGKTLGALDGVEGLSLATLAEGSGGPGGLGGLGGSGGVGGRGGAGAGSGESGGTGAPPSSTTVVINTPGPTSASPTASASKAGKVKVISHKVHGRTATVVVQVPGPGRLKLTGHGVKTVSEQTATSERVTIKTSLTKAGVAARPPHPH
ncbi:MAG TPA: hypothetical protein VLZ06_09850, partial [Solirubrobacteraceae bacterium]|nr:hypothetical protein [Solirubrobacteraceae bacterium]